MGTCKKCKHSSVDNYNNSGMLDCNNILLTATYNLPSAEVKDKGLITENDEGWGFHVAPNFGCIHFEER